MHAKFLTPVLAMVLLAVPVSVSAQTAPVSYFGVEPGQVPAMEISLGYTYLHANAPPGGCGCFSMNGGNITWVINATHGLSIVADMGGAYANQINNSDQNIKVLNFLFGGRYTMRKHKFQPYAEALVGVSNELSNYAYVQSVSALAASGGVGVNRTINRHLAFNIAEVDYIYSRLPNAQNMRQSDLRVRTGITFRFGPR